MQQGVENTNDHTRLEWHQKVSAFFDKVALLNLPGEEKKEIAETIIYDADAGIEYRGIILLAIIIATLGLLVNSVPVVIGAMLIAPIMRPIQTISFATTTGGNKLFVKGTRVLLGSIFLTIIVSILLTFLSPLSDLTNEIIIRTHPTFLDLLIALASGAVAFLAFGFKRLGIGIAGVAMAASLLPPLCVVGIGIARGAWSIAWGSFLLFMTNLMAILLAGYIVFHVFGFFPNSRNDILKSIKNLFYTLVIIALLSIPLINSIRHILYTNHVTTNIRNDIETTFAEISVEGISVDSKQEQKVVKLSLEAPYTRKINQKEKEAIMNTISTHISPPREVDIALTPRHTYTLP